MRQMLLERIRAARGPHSVSFIDTVPGLKQCEVEIWLFLMREVEIWESNTVGLVSS